MITGFATPEGTKKFAERGTEISQQNYKNVNNLTLSNVGIGTYLGNPDVETDKLVEDAIKKSIELLDRKDFQNYNIIDLRVDGKIIVE